MEVKTGLVELLQRDHRVEYVKPNQYSLLERCSHLSRSAGFE